jgi:glutathionyl-hydroquinone reductase
LENRLADGRAFLHGDEPLASDVLLFTPAVRFDLVYRPIFRACLKRFSDYPALSRWLERTLALPNVAATVRPDEILAHYDDEVGTALPLNRAPAAGGTRLPELGGAHAPGRLPRKSRLPS